MKDKEYFIEENLPPGSNEKARIRSIQRFVKPDHSSYDGNIVNIGVGADGSVNFSDDFVESYIYLYPQQTELLLRLLRIKED